VTHFQLFSLRDNECHELHPSHIALERDLQQVLEHHLEPLLKVRFLASEYSTGEVHRGRIDTLGLDEFNSPLILEYKREADGTVINQGLFYLNWLLTHQAEFQLLVQNRYGAELAGQIDWSGARVICIAKDFARYDLEAIHQFEANLDLVTYNFFDSGLLSLTTVASKRRPGYLQAKRQPSARRQPLSVSQALARAPQDSQALFLRFVDGLYEIASDLIVTEQGQAYEFGLFGPLGRLFVTETQYPKLMVEFYCAPEELEMGEHVRTRSSKKGFQYSLIDEQSSEQALEWVRTLYARAERS
jgi:hypothetical protein